jgi:hypothetical protein
MNVTVDEEPGSQPGDESVKRVEALVSGILLISAMARWGVGQKNLQTSATQGLLHAKAHLQAQ